MTDPTSDQPPPALLLGLWLVTALGLVVAPFLTLHEVEQTVGSSDTASVAYDVDGWGRLQGDIGAGHGPRLGVIAAVLAAVLVVAVVATVLRRGAAWPALVGLAASAMVVVLMASVVLVVESSLALEDASTEGLVIETSAGAGLWLSLAVGLLAVLVVVLSLARGRGLRR